MSEPTAAVTPRRSPIKNPFYHMAVLRIALAVGIAHLLLKWGWGFAAKVGEVVKGYAPDFTSPLPGAVGAWEVAVRHVEISFVPFVAAASAALVAACAVYGLVAAAGGIRRMVYAAPSGLPGGLERADRAVENLFHNQVINPGGYGGWPTRLASSILGQRMLAMPRHLGFLDEDLGRSVGRWAVALGLLAAPCLLPEALAVRLGLGGRWPWPVHLALLAAAATLARAAALAASAPGLPRVYLYEQNVRVEEAGNPNAFFNHLRRALDTIRWEGMPNREVRVIEPVLDKVQPGDTGRYTGEIVAESQPVHRLRLLPLNALVMDLAGGGLLLAGCGMLMTRVLVAGRPASEAARIDMGLKALAGAAAVGLGVKLLRMGQRLHGVMRYQSDVVRVRVDGTYTSARIGLGDGRGGQMYTERAVFQGEADVRILGARAATENAYPQGERVIVNSRRDRGFDERMQRLGEAAQRFEPKGGRLAEIDLRARSVQDIVRANLRIKAMSAAAARGEAPGLAAPGQAEALPRQAAQAEQLRGEEERRRVPPAGEKAGALPTAEQKSLEAAGRPVLPAGADEAAGEDTKVCPECAERVKAAARKCRFCGHRFEEAEGAAPEAGA